MKVCQHGVLQRNPCLLLERFKRLRVIVLAKVLQAKVNGFLFTVLTIPIETGLDNVRIVNAAEFNIPDAKVEAGTPRTAVELS